MKIRQPNYNKRFLCLGGDCPDTCCRDWSIVPDEAALADYANAPEPLRSAIAAALTRDDDGDPCFVLRPDGFCSLLTEDGLCPIQRDWGEEHLCAHCGAYPRFTEEYGSLAETALAVSCPEAARLLMESPAFVLEERDTGGGEQPFEGIDPELLEGLELSRAAALELLGDSGRSLWLRLADLVAYADDLQDCIDFGAYTSMAQCEPEPVEGAGKGRLALAARLMEFCGEMEPLRTQWQELLARRREELWGVKRDYFALCTDFQRACPRWESHLTNLACYLVFRHWHKTVNDDALYGRAAFAAAACLLIYHLCLLQWKERGSLFPADEAALWSAFSREVEHLEENLTDFVEAMFDNQTWPLISALLEE